jgi:hypothetical protein
VTTKTGPWRKVILETAVVFLAGWRRWAIAVLLPVALLQSSQAQSLPNGAGSAPEPEDPLTTMFAHSETARYWVSGQNNNIFQYHPTFYAKYSGPNSFRSQADNAISNVSTLF